MIRLFREARQGQPERDFPHFSRMAIIPVVADQHNTEGWKIIRFIRHLHSLKLIPILRAKSQSKGLGIIRQTSISLHHHQRIKLRVILCDNEQILPPPLRTIKSRENNNTPPSP